MLGTAAISGLLQDEDTDQRGVAKRPSLPVLFFPAVAMWAGICAAEQIQWNLLCAGQSSIADFGSMISASLPVCIIISLGVLGALAIARRILFAGTSKFMPWSVAAAMFLGLLVGCLSWYASDVGMQTIGNGSYTLRIESDVSGLSEVQSGEYSMGRLIGSDGTSVLVRVMWNGDEPLPLGSECTAKGVFKQISDDQSGRWMHRQMISGSFDPYSMDDFRWSADLQGALGQFRVECSQALDDETLDSEGSALIRGIVMGDRSHIQGTEVDDAFRITGLAHLLAVSGSHLSVVAAMCVWLMDKMRISKKHSAILLCLATVAYLAFTGMQPSAFRACIMAAIGSFSWFAGRRRHSLSALSIAVMAMLCINPSNSYSIGFALSVLGVLGLCVFAPLARSWLEAPLAHGKFGEKRLGRALKSAAAPASMAITAQATTAPVSIPTFSTIPLMGPICNVIASPVIAVLLGAGMVALALAAIVGSPMMPLLGLVCQAAKLASDGVIALSHIPYCAIPAYSGQTAALIIGALGLVAIWVAWPQPNVRKTRRWVGMATAACIFAAVISIALGAFAGPMLVVMDVGQGDAILIRDGIHSMLIDTGKSDMALRSALGRNGVYHLDALLVTHFDSDHCGAIGSMESLVSVDKVLFARGSLAYAQGDGEAEDVVDQAASLCGDDSITEVGRGNVITLSEKMKLSVMWPSEDVTGSENSESICMLLECDPDLDGIVDEKVLLTGDAESETLEKIVGSVGDVDILKVGHHGSKVSVDDDTLNVLSPEAALISVGADNRYGHPAQSTIDLLQKHGAEVLRTDLDGDITVTFGADGLGLRCANI